MWDNERKFLWIRSIKHFDNCRQRLILLIVPQDFPNRTIVTHRESIVDNLRSFPKTSFNKFQKSIHYCYGFLFLEISEKLLKEFR